MVMAHILSQMEEDMMGNGALENNTVKEGTFYQMELKEKENGRLAKELNGLKKETKLMTK
jgi:hypothetical protein